MKRYLKVMVLFLMFVFILSTVLITDSTFARYKDKFKRKHYREPSETPYLRAKIGLYYARKLVGQGHGKVVVTPLLHLGFQETLNMSLRTPGAPNRKVLLELDYVRLALDIKDIKSAEVFLNSAEANLKDIRDTNDYRKRLEEVKYLRARIDRAKGVRKKIK